MVSAPRSKRFQVPSQQTTMFFGIGGIAHSLVRAWYGGRPARSLSVSKCHRRARGHPDRPCTVVGWASFEFIRVLGRGEGLVRQPSLETRRHRDNTQHDPPCGGEPVYISAITYSKNRSSIVVLDIKLPHVTSGTSSGFFGSVSVWKTRPWHFLSSASRMDFKG